MTLKKKIKRFWNSKESVLAGEKDQRLKINEQIVIEKLINFKGSICIVDSSTFCVQSNVSESLLFKKVLS